MITEFSLYVVVIKKGFLFVFGNEIVDVAPLQNLTELRSLWLGNNPITDIALLTNPGELEELLLFNTQVADISPLQGLNQRALARPVQHACG
ncbi:leucine-rich repeat domain-containing protein [Chlorogloeopsis fritschii PCC 9212]|uniref:Leucine-rich repeat domain-containing protein n=1 Tax=Chlorogloeopsis fritschii PCC 6912 TaxID=211165 RepID=A0A3S0XSG6_CHLFR|nr:leucine-rich repeat domain-containing protein [Chlorogloeopsis fritschii]RUR75944.1 hypothetical protein PCC6912_45160 [Chlorogloeopsis fritschii PCC 6912]